MNAAAIASLVLTVLQTAAGAAPIVLRGIVDARPFALDLWKKLTGQEASPADEMAIDAALADLTRRLEEPLPPAQPGDPDYKP